jgi:hypothetical protein
MAVEAVAEAPRTIEPKPRDVALPPSERVVYDPSVSLRCGEHGYAAMHRRDGYVFCRKCSDRETPPVGQKFDDGKARWDLVQDKALAQYIAVLTYGSRKYSPNGWRSVENPRARYYAAAMRHLAAWRAGEDADSESGLPHLAHAVTGLMFLLETDEDNKK